MPQRFKKQLGAAANAFTWVVHPYARAKMPPGTSDGGDQNRMSVLAKTTGDEENTAVYLHLLVPDHLFLVYILKQVLLQSLCLVLKISKHCGHNCVVTKGPRINRTNLTLLQVVLPVHAVIDHHLHACTATQCQAAKQLLSWAAQLE